jgi:AraC-like DNA-binding protein
MIAAQYTREVGGVVTSSTGSVSAASAVIVLIIAEKLGASRERILERVGLSPDRLRDPESHIPLATQHQLWETAVEECGDRALPLRVAEACTPATFNVLGYACMTAPNVREMLERLSRFVGLFLQGETLTLDYPGDNARLVLHQTTPKRLGRELSAESTIAKTIVAIRNLVKDGSGWGPSLVTFTHAAPPDITTHEKVFGCPVKFGAPRTEVIIPAPMLEWQFAKADPGLSQFFDKHAEEMLKRMGAMSDATARVRRAVTEALHAGDASETTVSKRLAWSERTLRRRLGEEGTSFRQVLDDVRRELAQGWLTESHMSIGEVAFLLGFSESSNFHRAFKRWTSQTPDEFRRSQR